MNDKILKTFQIEIEEIWDQADDPEENLKDREDILLYFRDISEDDLTLFEEERRKEYENAYNYLKTDEGWSTWLEMVDNWIVIWNMELNEE